MLCVPPHTMWLHPLSSYTSERSNNRDSSTSVCLLIGQIRVLEPICCYETLTRALLSAVLATWRAGGSFEGSQEEPPWRWSEHVWCLMMKAQKSVKWLNQTLWIIISLVVWPEGRCFLVLFFSFLLSAVGFHIIVWKKYMLFFFSSPLSESSRVYWIYFLPILILQMPVFIIILSCRLKYEGLYWCL